MQLSLPKIAYNISDAFRCIKYCIYAQRIYSVHSRYSEGKYLTGAYIATDCSISINIFTERTHSDGNTF